MKFIKQPGLLSLSTISLMKVGLMTGALTTSSQGIAQETPTFPITEYGKVCKEKLGPIPEFSCLDDRYFKTIPITLEGKPYQFNSETGKWQVTLDDGTVKTLTGTSQDQCDRPAYLGTNRKQCLPDSRIGRLPLVEGHEAVDTVVICRRYFLTTPDSPVGTKSHRSNFADVAIVQHDNNSGDTCWFQMLATSSGKIATAVPSPSVDSQVEPEKAARAADFWLTPRETANIDCTSCHDSGPFMYSPYLNHPDLVFSANHPVFAGQPVVPQKTLKPEEARKQPYRSLGKEFSRWPGLTAVEPINPRAKECVACHRIGERQTCDLWVADAIGKRLHHSAYRSDWSKNQFDHRVWMPVIGYKNLDAVDEQKWSQHFELSAEEIAYCCNNPQDTNRCVSYPIPATGFSGTDKTGESYQFNKEDLSPDESRLRVLGQPMDMGVVETRGRVKKFELVLKLQQITHKDLKVSVRVGGNRWVALTSPQDRLQDTFGHDGTLKLNFGPENAIVHRNLIGNNGQGTWQLKIEDSIPENDIEGVEAALKSAILNLEIVPENGLN